MNTGLAAWGVFKVTRTVCREVVERRLYTVTGEHASEEKINDIINSGQAENIFQEALMAQGRGKVRKPCCLSSCP